MMSKSGKKNEYIRDVGIGIVGESHTLNHYKNVVVIEVFPFAGKILEMLRHPTGNKMIYLLL